MENTKTPITDLTRIPVDIAEQFLDHLVEFKRAHQNKIHIVKPGGVVIDDPVRRKAFAKDVVRLSRDFGLQVAVIHGAGVQITQAIKDETDEASEFPNGLRHSHARHMDIIDAATMRVNQMLCREIDEAGEGHVIARGLPGHHPDINMVSKPLNIENDNYTGAAISSMSVGSLKLDLAHADVIPVITNMANNLYASKTGVNLINVNADRVANDLAIALGAYRLLLCTEMPGVVEILDGVKRDFKKLKLTPAQLQELIDEGKIRVIPEIKPDEVQSLFDRGVIEGGMVTKVREAFDTASRMGQGSAVVILDHRFSVETLTPRGAGTIFRAPSA